MLISCFLYIYFKYVERKNNEMWTDSEEMMKMRDYLDCKVNLPEPEYIQMDKIYFTSCCYNFRNFISYTNNFINI